MDHSLTHLRIVGADLCKTVLVVSPKGTGFLLKNASDPGYGAESWLDAAPPVGEEPLYSNLCKLTEGWTREWDGERKVAYMSKDQQWVSYEDPRSVEEKVTYVNMKGMAGLAVNHIAMDDFRGECSNTTFPLLRSIQAHLHPQPCEPAPAGRVQASRYAAIASIILHLLTLA